MAPLHPRQFGSARSGNWEKASPWSAVEPPDDWWEDDHDEEEPEPDYEQRAWIDRMNR
jgi:hypothetical protein